MKIINPINATDDFLKLQAAKIKFKLDDDKKYLKLLKTFGVWNSSGKQKEKIPLIAKGNYLKYKYNNLGTFIALSNFSNIAFNPIIGIPLLLYSSFCWGTTEEQIISYENNLNKQQDGTKNIEDQLANSINNYTRLANVGLGTFYLSKSLLDFAETKTINPDSLVDFGIGTTLLSMGISQYLLNSDDKGLKDKQKEKELKGLEKIAFNN